MRGRTGQFAGRALRAPGQLSGRRLACAGGCTPGMPASCVPQGRGVAPQACRLLAFRKAGKVPAKPAARTCTILSIKRGVSPPLRGANRQRRHSAGAWPHGPCRLLAFRKAGKVPAKPPPRTCVDLLKSTSVSELPVARIAQREHPPRTCVSVLHKRGVSPPLQGAKRQRRHSAA